MSDSEHEPARLGTLDQQQVQLVVTALELDIIARALQLLVGDIALTRRLAAIRRALDASARS
jgi:hypothetical protein